MEHILSSKLLYNSEHRSGQTPIPKGSLFISLYRKVSDLFLDHLFRTLV